VRKFFVAVVVAMLVVGLVSCSSSDDKKSKGSGSSPSGLAFTPVSDGTLTVQTALPAPGFWNGDDPGSLTGGFEYEMARKLAKQLGLELKVDNVDFGALVAGTTTDFDLALSQITKNADREKVADFSDGYFGSDQGVLVNKGTEVKTLDEAKKVQWGVQSGTTSETFLNKSIKPDKEARSYGQTTELFAALLAKDIDAVLLDTVIVLPQSKQPGYEDTAVVGQFKTGEVYGALLPKGSKNLATVNTLLTRFKNSGALDRLSKKYLEPAPSEGLGGDPAKVPAIPF
jgi:polar amino acid transport system substrate-binding protein